MIVLLQSISLSISFSMFLSVYLSIYLSLSFSHSLSLSLSLSFSLPLFLVQGQRGRSWEDLRIKTLTWGPYEEDDARPSEELSPWIILLLHHVQHHCQDDQRSDYGRNLWWYRALDFDNSMCNSEGQEDKRNTNTANVGSLVLELYKLCSSK